MPIYKLRLGTTCNFQMSQAFNNNHRSHPINNWKEKKNRPNGLEANTKLTIPSLMALGRSVLVAAVLGVSTKNLIEFFNPPKFSFFSKFYFSKL